jgi:hypothetical protein
VLIWLYVIATSNGASYNPESLGLFSPLPGRQFRLIPSTAGGFRPGGRPSEFAQAIHS